MTWLPNFQLYILYSVKFGTKICTRCGLCQDTISTYKLSIFVKNMWTKFHEIQGPVTFFFNLTQTHGPNSPKCKKYNNYVSVLNILEYLLVQRAQWLSGRVLDARLRGRGFEPHQRHCVVVLEQDLA